MENMTSLSLTGPLGGCPPINQLNSANTTKLTSAGEDTETGYCARMDSLEAKGQEEHGGASWGLKEGPEGWTGGHGVQGVSVCPTHCAASHSKEEGRGF